MCGKYSAEWWQRVAKATSEPVQNRQSAAGASRSVQTPNNKDRQDASADADDLMAASAGC
jgi:hypothetical protein